MKKKQDKIINGYKFVADDTDEQTYYYAKENYPDNCYVCIQDDGRFQAVHYGECLTTNINSAQKAIDELEEILKN